MHHGPYVNLGTVAETVLYIYPVYSSATGFPELPHFSLRSLRYDILLMCEVEWFLGTSSVGVYRHAHQD